MSETLALDVQRLSHNYGQLKALRELDLSVSKGEVFALLGPNGSGKSTLFRLISTIAQVQSGDIRVFGDSVATYTQSVRSQLGVVFQSPSLDPQLTVEENIRCHAAVYGLAGSRLKKRLEAVTGQLGVADRLATRTAELSGGLKRRVELAKGILHQPRLLLMDEPSTGLDPTSRMDLWRALRELNESDDVTIVLTTHLLEEADKADRIAIIHEGKNVTVGRPSDLRVELGEQVLTIQTSDQVGVAEWLSAQSVETQQIDQHLRVTGSQAANLVAPLTERFGSQVQTLTLGQPSLEDVFVAKTGHRFWGEETNTTIEGNKRRR